MIGWTKGFLPPGSSSICVVYQGEFRGQRPAGHIWTHSVIICFTGFPKLLLHVYFILAWIQSSPEMNLIINPICKYSQESHLDECITHARSGSFTTEPTQFKPSDILEVWGFFLFCFLWLSHDESAAEHLGCKPSHEKGRLFSLRAHGLRLHTVSVCGGHAKLGCLYPA